MSSEVYEKIKTIHHYGLGKIKLCDKKDGKIAFFIENNMADNQGFDSIIVEKPSLGGESVFPEYEHDGIGCDFCDSHTGKTLYCAILTDYIHEKEDVLQTRSVSYTRSICKSCAYDFSEKLQTIINRDFSEDFIATSL